MKLRSLFTALCLAVTLPALASAQAQRRVTGRVTAQGGSEPLAGASVQVVGTQIGQYSDDQGRFSIMVPAGPQQIRVRRIGYKAQVLPVTADQTELNVQLVKDVLQLEAEVITGAATTVNKANLATDVATLNADQVNRVPTPTVENALQGKIAGAQVVQNSGAPGGGMQIRLRGVTSIFGASDPLYVVDGVLLSNDVVQGGINAIGRASTATQNASNQDNGVNRVADLNPADIESIEILKGSSASAIYGSKAANGVVVIKTKQGRAGRTEFSLTQRVGTFDLANKIDTRRFTREEAGEFWSAGNKYGMDSATMLANYDRCGGFCDHQEQLFGKNELAYETALSLRGGNQTTRFFGSGLLKRDPGIAANTGYDKQALRLNVTQLAGSRLTLNLNSNLVHSVTRRGISNNDNANITPYFVFGAVPSYLDFRPQGGVFPSFYDSNPLQTFELLKTPEEVWRLIGSVDGNFNFLSTDQQTLDLKMVAGIDNYSLQANIFSPREAIYEPADGLPGTNTALNGVNTNANYSVNLTHSFSAASKLFTATTSAGMQREYRALRSSNVVGKNCPSGLQNFDACSVSNAYAARTAQRDLAWYAQEEFLTLDERLLLTAAARGQRSTANGDVEKFYIYPKASASYRLPVSYLPSVDEFKLRVAAGRAGNNPPLATMKFTAATAGNYDGTGGISGGTVFGNPAIKPETSNEIEGGFDLTAFGSRANLAFTMYQKTVTDLILRPVPAPSQGGYAQQYLNGGELRNRGTEVALALTPIEGNNFQWVSRTTFAMNRGLVVDLPSYIPANGFTIGGAFGYGAYTIMEGKAPTIIRGSNGLTGAAAATIDYANTAPDHVMGFSNEFSFRNVRLSSLFEWQKGGDILNITQDVYDAFGLFADTAGTTRRLALHEDGAFYGNWQDGSFVKLREVTLSYELPTAFRQRLFGNATRGMRAELSGRNLLTWTKYEGVDPEVSNFGNQNIIRNADLAPFPPSRSFFFSLGVDF